MEQIMEWLGDNFYKEVTVSETKTGYTSTIRSTGNYNYEIVQLPLSETTTRTETVLNVQAVCAFVIIVLTFVTVVTFLKKAVLGR